MPNYSGRNDFFYRSVMKEDKFYEDLYVWHPKVYSVKPEKPPNNWVIFLSLKVHAFKLET